MSILSGPRIICEVINGNIEIDPFLIENVGQNSIDLRLGKTLLVMQDAAFDLTQPISRVEEITIPSKGYFLTPGIGYLGSTMERVCCRGPFVPWFDGRSTVGRYFLQVHQTAGRGDHRFNGSYTAEIMAAYRPVRVYAGMPLFQITFFDMIGEPSGKISRYDGQTGPRLPSPLPLPEYPR